MRCHVHWASLLTAFLLAQVTAAAADRDDLVSLKTKVQSLETRLAALERQVAALEPVRQQYEQHQAAQKEIEEIGGTPGAIPSTNQPVGADTGLEVGQLLQVEWSGQWWAARILALLPDGRVKIHYLGWAPNWDEVVPRWRLQLDPDALLKAKRTIACPPRSVWQPPERATGGGETGPRSADEVFSIRIGNAKAKNQRREADITIHFKVAFNLTPTSVLTAFVLGVVDDPAAKVRPDEYGPPQCFALAGTSHQQDPQTFRIPIVLPLAKAKILLRFDHEGVVYEKTIEL